MAGGQTPGGGLRPAALRRGVPFVRFVMTAMVMALGLGALASPAAAQNEPLEACPSDLESVQASDSAIRIVKVDGLIDPVMHNYLLNELDKAESDEVLGLVLWLNSKDTVISDQKFVELATRLADSPVTIAMWVGQSGATAQGGAAELLGVADLVGVSSGSTIGSTGSARLPDSFEPAFGDAATRLESATISADEAIQLGISVGPQQEVATIGPFVSLIPGYEVLRCSDAGAADAAGADSDDPDAAGNESGADGSGLRTVPITRNELTGLPLTSQFFHTVASPEVAYLFFVLGLALLLFELYTAGVGIAGVLGAGFVAFGCYGLAILPTRWWGIGLLIVSVLLMAVDVQTNVPRLYSALGVAAFVVGTFTLYDGVTMSWVTAVAGIIGAILYAYAGMPSMVRTRFSTPTIGRTWMIGETGQAVTDVSPEGTVKIGDATWRAITNRATPVTAGDTVRVIGLDRLLLEIEPEEGGAKDYRDRSGKNT